MADFDFKNMEASGLTGMDAFFDNEPEIVTPAFAPIAKKANVRVKVGSLNQLEGFSRLSSETLIHHSTNDLWSIGKEADGNYYIERLFRDDGNPIKG